MRDGWRDSFEAADGAELEEGWIAETDDGDTVWVDAQCETSDGTWLPNAKTATFAVLDAS